MKADLTLAPLEFLTDGSYRSVLVTPQVKGAAGRRPWTRTSDATRNHTVISPNDQQPPALAAPPSVRCRRQRVLAGFP